jgi:hypothetical protein
MVIEQLRARQSGLCWLCDKPLNFDDPKHRKYRTKEHHLPVSKGGGNEIGNLRLCCGGCNKALKDHSPEKKDQIRSKLRANRERVALANKARQSVPPAKASQGKPKIATVPTPQSVRPASPELSWRRAALVAGGVACLATGFAAGLLVGIAV